MEQVQGLTIKPGDRIRIISYSNLYHTTLHITGTVRTANNYPQSHDGPDDWYIEFDRDAGGIVEAGYGYWKQSIDGGIVEVIS